MYSYQVLGLWYCAHAYTAHSSVRKWKSFKNQIYSLTFTLFAFHTNKKQYLDILHNIQQKKEINIRMHNKNFDSFLRSVHKSAKLQITKMHKNAPKIKCYLYNAWVFALSYKTPFSPKQHIFWYPSPDFPWAIQVHQSKMCTQHGRQRVRLYRE